MNNDVDREFQELTARLEAELGTAEAPPARRERAMFVEGVAQRPRTSRIRLFFPALATMALMAAIFFMGRSSQPNDALYPVLNAIGVTDSTVDDVDKWIELADDKLDRGSVLVEIDRKKAIALATDAIFDLGRARALLAGVTDEERPSRAIRIETLKERALELIEDAQDDSSGPGSGDDSIDDSSGPGSGDEGDDASDDNSGPGSDDGEDDDNDHSGSSGEDSDSSGSGSGDDTFDDSSGSGSGDDSDNSGSGSDSSGSGSGGDSGGDSSGSGSG